MIGISDMWLGVSIGVIGMSVIELVAYSVSNRKIKKNRENLSGLRLKIQEAYDGNRRSAEVLNDIWRMLDQVERQHFKK